MLMPFGKHKGEQLASLPEDYLRWLIDQDWLKDDLRNEIDDILLPWKDAGVLDADEDTYVIPF